MPIRRFRSVEDMTSPFEEQPLDGGNLRAAVAVSRTCIALDGRRPAAGVRRFRSVEEAWQARLAWEREPR